MCDTCVPSLIVISTAINQLETKVSLNIICCLRLFVVVYKHVMLLGRGLMCFKMYLLFYSALLIISTYYSPF